MYAANPDQSDFGYVRGSRNSLLDPTAQTMAAYFVRLLSWIVLGTFTDEHGVVHTAPRTFNLTSSAGHTWELFNEAEHGYVCVCAYIFACACVYACVRKHLCVCAQSR